METFANKVYDLLRYVPKVPVTTYKEIAYVITTYFNPQKLLAIGFVCQICYHRV